jgi:hypothetical protein
MDRNYFKLPFNTMKDAEVAKVLQDFSLNLIRCVLHDLRCFLSIPLNRCSFFKTVFVTLSKIKQYQSANPVLTVAKVFAQSVDITPKSVGNQLRL